MNGLARSPDSLTLTREWWRPAEVVRVVPVDGGRAAFAALVLYTVVLVAAPQEFVPAIQPFRLALALAAVAMLCHVRDRWARHVPAPPLAPEMVLAGCLVAWAAISIPFSYWPGGSVSVLLDMFLKSIALFVLLAGAVNTPGRLRVVCGVLVGCSVPIALTALANYRGGVMFEGTADRIAGYGTSGLAGNPNDLALLLNLVLPIAAAFAIGGASRRVRMAAAAASLLFVGAIVVTFSRAGFLTLAVTGVLFLWSMARRGRIGRAVGLVAVVLLALALLPGGYVERLATLTDITSDSTGSAQDRWRDTAAAAGFVLEHPLIGAGIGQDVLALNDARGATWLSVHNVYLNIAVDLGLVGLALFLALQLTTAAGVARVERRWARTPRHEVGELARGLRIAMAGFAVAACFHPVSYHPYFYYLAGLAVAVTRIDRRARAARKAERCA